MAYIIPLFSFGAWILIWIMSFLNLSLTLPIQVSYPGTIIFVLVSSAGSFLVPLAVRKQKNRIRFFILFFAGLTAQISTAIIAGGIVHRDFYGFPAQIILLYLIIFFVQLDTLGIIKHKDSVYRILSIFTLTVFIVWFAWLLMMFYAIVSRAEPRWIESTVYNLLNGIIGLLFLASVILLRNRSKRRIKIVDKQILLDERDISSILSPQESNVIVAFLSSPNHSLTCSGLYYELQQTGKETDTRTPQCRKCRSDHWKATSCSVYRNFKNRIKDTKKYLELLQIGTIVPVSENPREIKEFGWMLRFFDDVGFESSGKHRIGRLFEHVHQ